MSFGGTDSTVLVMLLPIGLGDSAAGARETVVRDTSEPVCRSCVEHTESGAADRDRSLDRRRDDGLCFLRPEREGRRILSLFVGIEGIVTVGLNVMSGQGRPDARRAGPAQEINHSASVALGLST